MATKQQGGQSAEQEDKGGQVRNAAIGEHVLSTLGQPGDLQSVQVRRLWGDHYRVNIFVGGDSTSVKVAHSYFLEVDGDGRIVASNPKITRQY